MGQSYSVPESQVWIKTLLKSLFDLEYIEVYSGVVERDLFSAIGAGEHTCRRRELKSILEEAANNYKKFIWWPQFRSSCVIHSFPSLPLILPFFFFFSNTSGGNSIITRYFSLHLLFNVYTITLTGLQNVWHLCHKHTHEWCSLNELGMLTN